MSNTNLKVDAVQQSDNAKAPSPISQLKTVPVAEAVQLALARGHYRVENVFPRIDRHGATYFVVTLVDLSGSAEFLAWENRVPGARELKPGMIVEAATYIRTVDSRPYAKLGRVNPIEHPTFEDRLTTLPAPACPIPGVVDRICKVLEVISRDELHQFMARLFSDEVLLRLFLTVKASADDHHQDPGGLALHSVEAAEIVAVLPMLRRHEQEIAVVAALLHDIGKVYTLSGTPEAEIRKRLFEHDALTLEILAPALVGLDVAWPDAGLAIRHILTAESPGSRYGTPERSVMAIVVRSADRMSQQVALARQRLGDQPGISKLPRGRWVWSAADVPSNG